MERGSAEMSRMSCSRSEGCAQCAIPGEVVGISLAPRSLSGCWASSTQGTYSKRKKGRPAQCRAAL